MKLITPTAILLGVLTSQFSLSQGIDFVDGDWGTVRALAEDQKKLVFIDVYTDWCGPCKVLKQEVYPQPEAGELFNKYYIAVHIDAEDEAKGQEFAETHEAGEFPTLMVMHPIQGELGRIVGGIDLPYLLNFGQRFVDEKPIESLRAAWIDGNRDSEFAEEFLTSLKVESWMHGVSQHRVEKLEGEYRDVVEGLFFGWSESERLSGEGFDFIQKYPVGSRGTPIFDYLVENYKTYLEVSPNPHRVASFICSVNSSSSLSTSEEASQYRKDISGYLKTAYEMCEESGHPNIEFFMSMFVAGPKTTERLSAIEEFLYHYDSIAWRPDWWYNTVAILNQKDDLTTEELTSISEMAETLYSREPKIETATEYAKSLTKLDQREEAAKLIVDYTTTKIDLNEKRLLRILNLLTDLSSDLEDELNRRFQDRIQSSSD